MSAGKGIEEVCETLSRCGFAVIAEDAVGQPSREAMARFGRILALPGLVEVQTLEPREKDLATPNTYSGNFGRGEFPLHTDLAHWCLPPRYLVLRCVIGTEDVATRLLDGQEVIASVGESELCRALVRPRRPLASRRALLRLLESRDGAGRLLRWDSLFIVPATTGSEATFEAVRFYLDSAKTTEVTLSKPGDTLVIDNWRMLHGRASVSRTLATRRIDRVYLDELA
jgi:L-asparagine oxygenase